MNKTLKIAVTGGIGSGKSYALDIIKGAGYPVISCDGVYADLLKKRDFLKKLKTAFPETVEGVMRLKLNREKLARIVFKDGEALEKLNGLTHPLIVKECLSRADKLKGAVFIEVPLLFEGGFQNLFDKVIIITREKEERINAVIARSNITRDEVVSRMRAQVDYDALDKSPYIVIENCGDYKQKLLTAINEIIG